MRPMPDQEMGPDSLVPKGLPSARRGYDHHAVEQSAAPRPGSLGGAAGGAPPSAGRDRPGRRAGVPGARPGRAWEATWAGCWPTPRRRPGACGSGPVPTRPARLAAAVVEARRLVAEAEAQSFHLRADAWAAAEELLHEAEEAHRAGLAAADAEVLLIRAEAEQEAYRLVATAKREAQDITRGARFEAERTVLEIRAQPERILPVEAEPVEPVEASRRACPGRWAGAPPPRPGPAGADAARTSSG